MWSGSYLDVSHFSTATTRTLTIDSGVEPDRANQNKGAGTVSWMSLCANFLVGRSEEDGVGDRVSRGWT
jgi:hypothetical protein